MKKYILVTLISAVSILPFSAKANVPLNEVVVDMHSVTADGVGSSIGTINIKETEKGLVLTPKLSGLPPGARGFHIHENPDCAPKEKEGKQVAALSAGSHFDPEKSGKHMGPDGNGHKGDMPTLRVNDDGTANTPITVPHLKMADIVNRSIMIHSGGDNYSDSPEPLGGGGPRIACGVIKG